MKPIRTILVTWCLLWLPAGAMADGFLYLPLRQATPVVEGGWRYAGGTLHYAINYATTLREPIIASCDGVAIATSSSSDAGPGAYGNFVLQRCNETVDSGDHYMVIYAHLDATAPGILSRSRFDTSYDSWTPIGRGEVIGYAGAAGMAGLGRCYVHLHFEVFTGEYANKRDHRVDPYNVYDRPFAYPGDGEGALWAEWPPTYATSATVPMGDPLIGCSPIIGCFADDPDGLREPMSGAFASTISRWRNRLGCPRDAGGGAYVHDVNGLLIQDFYQRDASQRFAGSDGWTALVYNRELIAAPLLRTGFWGAYKCLAIEGGPASVGGAVLLGAPRNEEGEEPATPGLTRQNFQHGYMTWDGRSVRVHLDSPHAAIDWARTMMCLEPTSVVDNPPPAIDGDGDGFFPPGDCDDDNAAISPAAGERCDNGVDDDCDASIDEGCSTCAANETGVCADGLDNDCDSNFDCGDADCRGLAACAGACTPEVHRRCWVECPISEPSDCTLLNGPPVFVGHEPCGADGRWIGACLVGTSCESYTSSCTAGVPRPTIIQCGNGTELNGSMDCFMASGCSSAFYSGWAVEECADFCSAPDDMCTRAGDTRTCQLHCGSPSGPLVSGTEMCAEYGCGVLRWGMCDSGGACP